MLKSLKFGSWPIPRIGNLYSMVFGDISQSCCWILKNPDFQIFFLKSYSELRKNCMSLSIFLGCRSWNIGNLARSMVALMNNWSMILSTWYRGHIRNVFLTVRKFYCLSLTSVQHNILSLFDPTLQIKTANVHLNYCIRICKN